MMRFDESTLRRSLNTLSRTRQLTFLILLCERMMAELNKFAVETGFDGSLYRKCLDRAWSYLGGSQNLSEFDEMAQECFDGAPDTEEFNHPLISAALNAALSVGALMKFLSDYNIDHIVEAAGLARDTVALYAQSVEAVPPRSLSFKEIMGHPLVQQQLQRQAKDLTFLASLSTDVPQEIIPLIKVHEGRTSKLLPLEN